MVFLNLISVICPILNEEKYIVPFLESIIAQDYPHDKLEVFIIDGGSNDKTVEIINKFCIKNPLFQLLHNKDMFQSFALNIGIMSSKGEYIIRLDAHASYPSDYLSSLIKSATLLNSDNIGGICKTIPANSSIMAQAIALVMSHPFGVGNSMFRIGTEEIIQTDTVPFGCFKRSIFDKIGYFDTELLRNEDDEFNSRIIKSGGVIFLDPHIVIKYFSRDSILNMAKMFYQYGLFKPLVNLKIGSITTFRQIIPFLFVLFLIIGATMSELSNTIFTIYLFILAFYFLISFSISTLLTIKHRKFKLLVFLPASFLTIHLSYGLGYFLGLIQFGILHKKTAFISVTR